MAQRSPILKIGAAILRDGKMLLVRKRGVSAFITPGGKPEGGEGDLEALARELFEELGCGLAEGARFLGEFRDLSADGSGREVAVRMYEATLVGEPSARSEIEELAWFDGSLASPLPIAPSLRNSIVPSLVSAGLLRPA